MPSGPPPFCLSYLATVKALGEYGGTGWEQSSIDKAVLKDGSLSATEKMRQLFGMKLDYSSYPKVKVTSVDELMPDGKTPSRAAKAKVAPGDLLISIASERITQLASWTGEDPDDAIVSKIGRRVERAEKVSASFMFIRGKYRHFYLQLRADVPELDATMEGKKFTEIKPGGWADRRGLKVGDAVVLANDVLAEADVAKLSTMCAKEGQRPLHMLNSVPFQIGYLAAAKDVKELGLTGWEQRSMDTSILNADIPSRDKLAQLFGFFLDWTGFPYVRVSKLQGGSSSRAGTAGVEPGDLLVQIFKDRVSSVNAWPGTSPDGAIVAKIKENMKTRASGDASARFVFFRKKYERQYAQLEFADSGTGKGEKTLGLSCDTDPGKGMIQVRYVTEGGWASKNGIKPGDRIVVVLDAMVGTENCDKVKQKIDDGLKKPAYLMFRREPSFPDTVRGLEVKAMRRLPSKWADAVKKSGVGTALGDDAAAKAASKGPEPAPDAAGVMGGLAQSAFGFLDGYLGNPLAQGVAAQNKLDPHDLSALEILGKLNRVLFDEHFGRTDTMHAWKPLVNALEVIRRHEARDEARERQFRGLDKLLNEARASLSTTLGARGAMEHLALTHAGGVANRQADRGMERQKQIESLVRQGISDSQAVNAAGRNTKDPPGLGSSRGGMDVSSQRSRSGSPATPGHDPVHRGYDLDALSSSAAHHEANILTATIAQGRIESVALTEALVAAREESAKLQKTREEKLFLEDEIERHRMELDNLQKGVTKIHFTRGNLAASEEAAALEAKKKRDLEERDDVRRYYEKKLSKAKEKLKKRRGGRGRGNVEGRSDVVMAKLLETCYEKIYSRMKSKGSSREKMDIKSGGDLHAGDVFAESPNAFGAKAKAVGAIIMGKGAKGDHHYDTMSKGAKDGGGAMGKKGAIGGGMMMKGGKSALGGDALMGKSGLRGKTMGNEMQGNYQQGRKSNSPPSANMISLEQASYPAEQWEMNVEQWQQAREYDSGYDEVNAMNWALGERVELDENPLHPEEGDYEDGGPRRNRDRDQEGLGKKKKSSRRRRRDRDSEDPSNAGAEEENADELSPSRREDRKKKKRDRTERAYDQEDDDEAHEHRHHRHKKDKKHKKDHHRERDGYERGSSSRSRRALMRDEQHSSGESSLLSEVDRELKAQGLVVDYDSLLEQAALDRPRRRRGRSSGGAASGPGGTEDVDARLFDTGDLQGLELDYAQGIGLFPDAEKPNKYPDLNDHDALARMVMDEALDKLGVRDPLVREEDKNRLRTIAPLGNKGGGKGKSASAKDEQQEEQEVGGIKPADTDSEGEQEAGDDEDSKSAKKKKQKSTLELLQERQKLQKKLAQLNEDLGMPQANAFDGTEALFVPPKKRKKRATKTKKKKGADGGDDGGSDEEEDEEPEKSVFENLQQAGDEALEAFSPGYKQKLADAFDDSAKFLQDTARPALSKLADRAQETATDVVAPRLLRTLGLDSDASDDGRDADKIRMKQLLKKTAAEGDNPMLLKHAAYDEERDRLVREAFDRNEAFSQERADRLAEIVEEIESAVDVADLIEPDDVDVLEMTLQKVEAALFREEGKEKPDPDWSRAGAAREVDDSSSDEEDSIDETGLDVLLIEGIRPEGNQALDLDIKPLTDRGRREFRDAVVRRAMVEDDDDVTVRGPTDAVTELDMRDERGKKFCAETVLEAKEAIDLAEKVVVEKRNVDVWLVEKKDGTLQIKPATSRGKRFRDHVVKEAIDKIGATIRESRGDDASEGGGGLDTLQEEAKRAAGDIRGLGARMLESIAEKFEDKDEARNKADAEVRLLRDKVRETLAKKLEAVRDAGDQDKQKLELEQAIKEVDAEIGALPERVAEIIMEEKEKKEAIAEMGTETQALRERVAEIIRSSSVGDSSSTASSREKKKEETMKKVDAEFHALPARVTAILDKEEKEESADIQRFLNDLEDVDPRGRGGGPGGRRASAKRRSGRMSKEAELLQQEAVKKIDTEVEDLRGRFAEIIAENVGKKKETQKAVDSALRGLGERVTKIVGKVEDSDKQNKAGKKLDGKVSVLRGRVEEVDAKTKEKDAAVKALDRDTQALRKSVSEILAGKTEEKDVEAAMKEIDGEVRGLRDRAATGERIGGPPPDEAEVVRRIVNDFLSRLRELVTDTIATAEDNKEAMKKIDAEARSLPNRIIEIQVKAKAGKKDKALKKLDQEISGLRERVTEITGRRKTKDAAAARNKIDSEIRDLRKSLTQIIGTPPKHDEEELAKEAVDGFLGRLRERVTEIVTNSDDSEEAMKKIEAEASGLRLPSRVLEVSVKVKGRDEAVNKLDGEIHGLRERVTEITGGENMNKKDAKDAVNKLDREIRGLRKRVTEMTSQGSKRDEEEASMGGAIDDFLGRLRDQVLTETVPATEDDHAEVINKIEAEARRLPSRAVEIIAEAEDKDEAVDKLKEEIRGLHARVTTEVTSKIIEKREEVTPEVIDAFLRGLHERATEITGRTEEEEAAMREAVGDFLPRLRDRATEILAANKDAEAAAKMKKIGAEARGLPGRFTAITAKMTAPHKKPPAQGPANRFVVEVRGLRDRVTQVLGKPKGRQAADGMRKLDADFAGLRERSKQIAGQLEEKVEAGRKLDVEVRGVRDRTNEIFARSTKTADKDNNSKQEEVEEAVLEELGDEIRGLQGRVSEIIGRSKDEEEARKMVDDFLGRLRDRVTEAVNEPEDKEDALAMIDAEARSLPGRVAEILVLSKARKGTDDGEEAAMNNLLEEEMKNLRERVVAEIIGDATSFTDADEEMQKITDELLASLREKMAEEDNVNEKAISKVESEARGLPQRVMEIVANTTTMEGKGKGKEKARRASASKADGEIRGLRDRFAKIVLEETPKTQDEEEPTQKNIEEFLRRLQDRAAVIVETQGGKGGKTDTASIIRNTKKIDADVHDLRDRLAVILKKSDVVDDAKASGTSKRDAVIEGIDEDFHALLERLGDPEDSEAGQQGESGALDFAAADSAVPLRGAEIEIALQELDTEQRRIFDEHIIAEAKAQAGLVSVVRKEGEPPDTPLLEHPALNPAKDFVRKKLLKPLGVTPPSFLGRKYIAAEVRVKRAENGLLMIPDAVIKAEKKLRKKQMTQSGLVSNLTPRESDSEAERKQRVVRKQARHAKRVEKQERRARKAALDIEVKRKKSKGRPKSAPVLSKARQHLSLGGRLAGARSAPGLEVDVKQVWGKARPKGGTPDDWPALDVEVKRVKGKGKGGKGKGSKKKGPQDPVALDVLSIRKKGKGKGKAQTEDDLTVLTRVATGRGKGKSKGKKWAPAAAGEPPLVPVPDALFDEVLKVLKGRGRGVMEDDSDPEGREGVVIHDIELPEEGGATGKMKGKGVKGKGKNINKGKGDPVPDVLEVSLGEVPDAVFHMIDRIRSRSAPSTPFAEVVRIQRATPLRPREGEPPVLVPDALFDEIVLRIKRGSRDDPGSSSEDVPERLREGIYMRSSSSSDEAEPKEVIHRSTKGGEGRDDTPEGRKGVKKGGKGKDGREDTPEGRKGVKKGGKGKGGRDDTPEGRKGAKKGGKGKGGRDDTPEGRKGVKKGKGKDGREDTPTGRKGVRVPDEDEDGAIEVAMHDIPEGLFNLVLNIRQKELPDVAPLVEIVRIKRGAPPRPPDEPPVDIPAALFDEIVRVKKGHGRVDDSTEVVEVGLRDIPEDLFNVLLNIRKKTAPDLPFAAAIRVKRGTARREEDAEEEDVEVTELVQTKKGRPRLAVTDRIGAVSIAGKEDVGGLVKNVVNQITQVLLPQFLLVQVQEPPPPGPEIREVIGETARGDLVVAPSPAVEEALSEDEVIAQALRGGAEQQVRTVSVHYKNWIEKNIREFRPHSRFPNANEELWKGAVLDRNATGHAQALADKCNALLVRRIIRRAERELKYAEDIRATGTAGSSSSPASESELNQQDGKRNIKSGGAPGASSTSTVEDSRFAFTMRFLPRRYAAAYLQVEAPQSLFSPPWSAKISASGAARPSNFIENKRYPLGMRVDTRGFVEGFTSRFGLAVQWSVQLGDRLVAVDDELVEDGLAEEDFVLHRVSSGRGKKTDPIVDSKRHLLEGGSELGVVEDVKRLVNDGESSSDKILHRAAGGGEEKTCQLLLRRTRGPAFSTATHLEFASLPRDAADGKMNLLEYVGQRGRWHDGIEAVKRRYVDLGLLKSQKLRAKEKLWRLFGLELDWEGWFTGRERLAGTGRSAGESRSSTTTTFYKRLLVKKVAGPMFRKVRAGGVDVANNVVEVESSDVNLTKTLAVGPLPMEEQ
eukprot:g5826.t1